MKKIIAFVICAFSVSSLFAGGLVTNTNHSAMFTRLMCRDATLGVDAVYFNPAGLTRFNEGFYLSLNNQYINQTQTIGNNYQFLGDPTFNYTGIVKAPFFPAFYAAYKIGKFAISAGFNPIGGGGGAEFSDGLPSFEMMVADLVPMLQSQLAPLDATIAGLGAPDPGFRNVTGYSSNIYFKGSSIYFGYQANLSYEVSDVISLAIGARYVSAKNTYKGHVKDVMIDAPAMYGGTQTPGNYLRFIGGVLPLDPNGPIVQQLLGTANALDVQTNLEADVVRKGSGVTPIFSLNIAPNERFNLAVKYEFKTKLELATEVIDGKDAGGLFVDGAAVVADMPAQLVVGATMKPSDKLMISAGVNYFFDKNNDYDGSLDREVVMIDKNYVSYALGAEYGITDKLSMSIGGAISRTGVNDLYQSDQRYSLNTNSLGGGFGIKLSSMLQLDLGAQYTMYEDGSRGYPHNLGGTSIAVTETYDKSVWLAAIGLTFSFED